jgi:hypothetical protein
MLLDNSVSPGLIVSLDVKGDDAMLEMIERYEAANGKRYKVEWWYGDQVAVLTSPASVALLGNFPSRPHLYVEPVPEIFALPVDTDISKSDEVRRLEAEAYRVMEAKKLTTTIGETPTE